MELTTDHLSKLVMIALEAGHFVMEVYRKDIAVNVKADNSPVTEADTKAEKVILMGLQRDFPGIPIISEEAQAAGAKVEIGDTFFLVDPLDGTKEFISRNGEFTVNIGLIHKGLPVLGVVLAPAKGEIYAGMQGLGCLKANPPTLDFAPVVARPCPESGPTVLASRSHLDEATQAFIAAHACAGLANAGSSLKFCRLAEGAADLYPRFGRTMEWDTAAGHAVLLAAGGQVTQPDGTAFTYGKPGFENGPFVARGATA